MKQEKRWQSYEEVAAHLLNQLSGHFGVGRFEGKQVVPGESGTEWQLDAKGCSDGNVLIVVVECKRYVKTAISQSITGSLAWTIQDTGAAGGILVSPLGLQAGAKKVAERANIVEVILDQNSTTSDYVLRFLSQLHIGITEPAHATDHMVATLRDRYGSIIQSRET